MKEEKQTMESVNASLSFRERIFYGSGDFAANLIYSTLTAFLLVYYTNVVNVNAGTAASIMAVSRIFDGISDIIMGRIIDKTKAKSGKARPWMLRMSIPLAVCFVLMFSVPASISTPLQTAYMFLTYNLVSTICFTAVNVPYSALQGYMTTNQYERGLLGTIRMLMANAGTLTINTFFLKMCTFFGGGDTYNQRGWTISIICLAVGFIVVNTLCVLNCRERVTEHEREEKQSIKKTEEPTLLISLKSLLANKCWVLMVLFLFSSYFLQSTFFGSQYYYAQYVLKNEGSYSMIANCCNLTALIAMMTVIPIMLRHFSKKKIAVLGILANIVAFSATGLLAPSVTTAVITNILKGIALGCPIALQFGILQDTITYGAWLTGVNVTGMGNAASSFCTKIGSGLGTAALGFILEKGHFDTDPTGLASLNAIKGAYIWIPVIMSVLMLICLLFLDYEKYYDKAVQDMDKGLWKGSSENSER